MRALRVRSLDGPDALELVEIPEPVAPDGTAVIEVHAAGVSFVDLLLTRGEYQLRPEPPFVPGIEVAGVLRSAPAGCELAPGTRVTAATVMGGGFAEVAVAPVTLTFPAPASLSFVQAAALTINYQTAWLALRRRGRVAAGETVLVHGAAGGVGTAAIQVGKALGARALAVASTEEKAAVARAAGADDVLDAHGDWTAQARGLTDGRGVDAVFEPVGGDRLAASMRCLAPEGRLLVVGFAAGQASHLTANRVLLRQVDVVGVNWGGLLAHDPDYPRACAREIAALVEARAIKPLVGQTYDLADGAQALRALESRRATGKLVLVTAPDARTPGRST